MAQRMDYSKASPDGFKAMLGLEMHCKRSVEAPLLHLVKLRASQINGCAYCTDMHWTDARAAGETEQRLSCLAVWRECSFFTEKERAALAWTEALTLIATTHAPDEDYGAALEQFGEKGLVDLSWAIGAINVWNRVAIGFRAEPGAYVARAAH